MWFLIGGIPLALLWWADIGPFGQLHWGWVLLPFVLAAAWWTFSDAVGLTQRRAVNKMEERKVARRARDMKALGLDVQQSRRANAMREPARRPKAPPAGRKPPVAAPSSPPSKDSPEQRDPRP